MADPSPATLNAPMAPPLRVALIGYGLGGSAFHAPFIAGTEGLELAAIVTSDPGRAAAARSRYPRAPIRDRAERIWRSAGDYDVAVITTPNRTHVPLAMAALDAGLHAVVDKPLAATASESRALVEHARARGRVLTVYQNRRWDGDFLTVRKLVAAGELGDVHRFESRFERWRPELKPGWRQDADPAAAGGVLYDLGAHLIDQALVLFGPVNDVYAEVERVRAGAEVDDDTFIALTHASGVHSHLWMSLASAAEGPRFRVLGRRGAFTKHGVDPQEARLRSGADPAHSDLGSEPAEAWGILSDGNEERRVPTEAGDYGAFYALLERALRERGPLPVDPLESAAVLEVIERARGELRRK